MCAVCAVRLLCVHAWVLGRGVRVTEERNHSHEECSCAFSAANSAHAAAVRCMIAGGGALQWLHSAALLTEGCYQCSPTPVPRTSAGPWINRHRAAQELQLHFTVAGGRGAEHCALPSGPRKNYPTFTGPRR
ncbi:hypothetical protein NDU88_006887 [Pleurodeles waltl]|uniref:Secreted protein n=1 Tax=Pleurodeles waltl TaxID=8319 RepID=A0AAV7QMD6_PLEWA|nr:hypothetical protein NDU88_006887 [Pleurodeles waltl]